LIAPGIAEPAAEPPDVAVIEDNVGVANNVAASALVAARSPSPQSCACTADF
jgi:hypothetical protein